MNSEYLKYFIAACEYGSILEASRNLYISSQGLGQGIHRLEKSLGLELLTYTYNGVKPTEFGEIFYRQAVVASREISRLEALAQEYINDRGSTVTVGTIGQTKFYHGFNVCIDEFRRRYPQSPLKLSVIESLEIDELTANIRDGILDVGFLFHMRCLDEFEYFSVSGFSPLMLLISLDNPLASRASVGWNELSGLRYICASPQDPFTNLIGHLCKRHGFDPESLYYSSENSMNARLIDKNICALFIRQSYAQKILRFCQNTRLLPIEPEVSVAQSLFWKRNRVFDKDKQLFLDMVKDYFKNVIS